MVGTLTAHILYAEEYNLTALLRGRQRRRIQLLDNIKEDTTYRILRWKAKPKIEIIREGLVYRYGPVAFGRTLMRSRNKQYHSQLRLPVLCLILNFQEVQPRILLLIEG